MLLKEEVAPLMQHGKNSYSNNVWTKYVYLKLINYFTTCLMISSILINVCVIVSAFLQQPLPSAERLPKNNPQTFLQQAEKSVAFKPHKYLGVLSCLLRLIRLSTVEVTLIGPNEISENENIMQIFF